MANPTNVRPVSARLVDATPQATGLARLSAPQGVRNAPSQVNVQNRPINAAISAGFGGYSASLSESSLTKVLVTGGVIIAIAGGVGYLIWRKFFGEGSLFGKANDLAGDLVDAGSDLVGGVRHGVDELGNQLEGAASATQANIRALTDAGSRFVDTIGATVRDVGSGVSDSAKDVTKGLSNVTGKAVGVASSATSSAGTSVSQMGSSLSQAAGSGSKAVTQAVASGAQAASTGGRAFIDSIGKAARPVPASAAAAAAAQLKASGGIGGKAMLSVIRSAPKNASVSSVASKVKVSSMNSISNAIRTISSASAAKEAETAKKKAEEARKKAAKIAANAQAKAKKLQKQLSTSNIKKGIKKLF